MARLSGSSVEDKTERRDTVIACDSIYNLRDYGGYPLMGGGRLRSGLLFRSGQHWEASDADLGRVAALKLRTVIDLRGRKERTEYPCRWPAGFGASIIAAPGETADPARLGASPSHRNPWADLHSAVDAHKAMCATYASMPHAPVLVELLTRYLAALAIGKDASMIHCMAGKDRTGFAVMLVHHIVGVHPDDAWADYLASNDMPGREEWASRYRQRYGQLGFEANPDIIEKILSVDAAFMDAALRSIKQNSGTIDKYVESVLGVTPRSRSAIRDQLAA